MRLTSLQIVATSVGLLMHSPLQGEVQVKTTTGIVEGTKTQDGVRVFKGIPFAEPPVGDLRWQPPQPIEPWDGVRAAQSYGPSPIQNSVLAAVFGVPAPFSEDCLYLNVWTPQNHTDERLPVMVWIHGGAFALGATSQEIYDGSRLAQKGIVVVSIAYRLGPLGFLCHPELTREDGKRSGNYGHLDQILGLQWIQDNIAAFGGDPKNVTIFGESAGGTSVSMLAASPKAKGIFHRAISQSGGSFAPPRFANEGGQIVMPLGEAEHQGERFLAALGIENVAAARKLPANELLQGDFAWWPVFDGEVLPGDQYELYQSGEFNDTPILIGTNSDEGAMFARPGITPEDFRQLIRSEYGEHSEQILASYPHSTVDEAFEAEKDILRDSVFAWHTWTWARLHSEKGEGKVYVYYFDHRTPESPNGASHAVDLAYVFGNFVGPFWSKPRPEDQQLSEQIQSYWTNFARTGNPNANGLPAWAEFRLSNQQVMRLDAEPGPQDVPNLTQLKALDAYFAWRREEAQAKQ